MNKWKLWLWLVLAFDRVPHKHLLKKVSSYRVFRWIQNLLAEGRGLWSMARHLDGKM